MFKLRHSLVLLAFATLPPTLASVAAAYEGTGFPRYQLPHAWPKGPPSSTLSDLPKPDAATPRGTVQRVPVVVPDPRDPLSKPANKSPTETWLIGEEVLPPVVSPRTKGEKIAIHGQHDMPSAQKPRIAGPQRSPTRR